MYHLSEDDMVLEFYGEEEEGVARAAHLDDCAECRARFDQITADLKGLDFMPAPDPGPAYGTEVWLKIRRGVTESPAPRRVSFLRPWMQVAAAAAVVTVAFLAGLYWPRSQEGASAMGRERVFLVTVSSHLERAQVLLLDVSKRNAGDVSLSSDVVRAADLLGENRVIRASALRQKDARVAVLLEELERVLMEISNSPETIPSADLNGLQHRIDSQGLLFKSRVVRTRVLDQLQKTNPKPVKI